MSSSCVGKFSLKVAVSGSKEVINGIIFYDTEKEVYTARVDNEKIRNYSATSPMDASMLAVGDYVETQRAGE